MIAVTCPHCASRFRLPAHRVGPGGARVRCAECEDAFDWVPERMARGSVGSEWYEAHVVLKGLDGLDGLGGFEPIDEFVESEFEDDVHDVFDTAQELASDLMDPFAARSARHDAPPAVRVDEAPPLPQASGVEIPAQRTATLVGFAFSDFPTPASPGAPSSAVDELDADDATPAMVARLAVEELVNAGADELLAAYDAGELFARFGPELIGAWQRCVTRLGVGADPAVFRAALCARLGVELPGWREMN